MLITFLFLLKNICCGYSLEASRWDASNEYPQHMFSRRKKKNIFLRPRLVWSSARVQSFFKQTVETQIRLPACAGWVFVCWVCQKVCFLMLWLQWFSIVLRLYWGVGGEVYHEFLYNAFFSLNFLYLHVNIYYVTILPYKQSDLGLFCFAYSILSENLICKILLSFGLILQDFLKLYLLKTITFEAPVTAVEAFSSHVFSEKTRLGISCEQRSS